MKKKVLCFILFFIILFITVAGCISNANNKNKDQNKEETEIGYLENKIMSLLNELNNIQFENYNITVSKINGSSSSSSEDSKNKSEQSKKSSSQGEKNKESNSEEESSGDKNSNQSSNSSSSEKSSQEGESDSDSSSTESKQYKLERTSILTNENEVDWQKIKNEIELMYASIPTITLDLYRKNISQEDILNFNKEMDNLIQAAKEENKENSLKTLANLYSYIPKYSRVISNETKCLVIETKSNLFYAYSLLDSEDWDKIKEYNKKAIESYTRILNNIDEEKSSERINKCYILLNELNNAANMKDRDIYLIKYKNLLEELSLIQ